MDVPDGWPWAAKLDALVAAPGSHRLLLQNDQVRVLEISISPGAREPEHTHSSPSVMIVDQPARIRYYQQGKQTFESPQASGEGDRRPRIIWMGPEGPHAVENIDTHPYHGWRVEIRLPAEP